MISLQPQMSLSRAHTIRLLPAADASSLMHPNPYDSECKFGSEVATLCPMIVACDLSSEHPLLLPSTSQVEPWQILLSSPALRMPISFGWWQQHRMNSSEEATTPLGPLDRLEFLLNIISLSLLNRSINELHGFPETDVEEREGH